MSFDVSLLGDVMLEDPEGEFHRLGKLWTERPHVLLFLRHFG